MNQLLFKQSLFPISNCELNQILCVPSMACMRFDPAGERTKSEDHVTGQRDQEGQVYSLPGG